MIAPPPPPGVGPLWLGRDTGRAPQPWRPWAIGGAVAGAAVGIGVGVLGALQHDQKVSDFNKRPCAEALDGSIVNKDTGMKDQTCANLHASYKNAKTLAIAGFTAGAALGVTALILYLTTPGAGGGWETAMAIPYARAVRGTSGWAARFGSQPCRRLRSAGGQRSSDARRRNGQLLSPQSTYWMYGPVSPRRSTPRRSG